MSFAVAEASDVVVGLPETWTIFVCMCGCRTAVRRAESIRYLVPDLIIEYITQHKLYLTVTDTNTT